MAYLDTHLANDSGSDAVLHDVHEAGWDPCSSTQSHLPNSKDPVDLLIAAAESGCLRCVSYLVSIKHVDPTAVGHGIWGLCAVDAAERGAVHGRVGCNE
eukprot:10346899-Karenia_brevis.AAC.1